MLKSNMKIFSHYLCDCSTKKINKGMARVYMCHTLKEH